MPFSSALRQLQQQLRSVIGTHRGFLCLAVPLPDEPDGLAWLDAQPVWPKFYWQQREGKQRLMALGEVQRAETLRQAAELLDSLPAEGCLVGANEFSLRQSYLFLPRLIWHGNTLKVFLHGELQEEAQAALGLIERLRPAKPLPELPRQLLTLQHFPDGEGWRQQVEAALRAIQTGSLDKVVLARATDLRFSQAFSAASLLQASREVNHDCYHFLLSPDARQAFVGSSPERLFHRQGLAFSSEALAGTCASSSDPQRAQQLADALLKDEKNRRENRLVVEDICQRLRPIAREVDVCPAAVVRLRKVQHLRCDIQGLLHKRDDRLLIRRLQPTAAVAGLPRQQAQLFIQQHEPFSRGWYAGSVGWLSASESEFTVALRCGLVEEDSVRLYAGAGIVAGSEAPLEWQEINHKASGLATLLGVEIASESCPKSS
ncbi:isochorismate synthase [Erwinia typographi]|uniref:Isochorismate synthase MenF n=1 Tax=Erwinia typographi TaxID=371042 RepID=A0A0A3Z2B9_9GAMM|nr:isochorismate synthase [Erwinia typographi]KGT91781.1 isochorismate synthase [Erwinia typographi]